MIVEWIQSYLEANQEQRDRIGLSAAGKCGRQLAYKHHKSDSIPLKWRSLSIFDDGNQIQDQIRGWLHVADKPSCYYLASEEQEVSLLTPKGRKIIGHVDGVIHHTFSLGDPVCKDGEHKERLLEIKSMSATGFRMLRKEGLEKSYICQVSCYLKALDLQEAVVICKCKDTSDLQELILRRDDEQVAEALQKIDLVLDSTTPDMVQRMYAANESGKLPWQCAYCPYVALCWEKYLPEQVGPNQWVLRGDYLNA